MSGLNYNPIALDLLVSRIGITPRVDRKRILVTALRAIFSLLAIAYSNTWQIHAQSTFTTTDNDSLTSDSLLTVEWAQDDRSDRLGRQIMLTIPAVSKMEVKSMTIFLRFDTELDDSSWQVVEDLGIPSEYVSVSQERDELKLTVHFPSGSYLEAGPLLTLTSPDQALEGKSSAKVIELTGIVITGNIDLLIVPIKGHKSANPNLPYGKIITQKLMRIYNLSGQEVSAYAPDDPSAEREALRLLSSGVYLIVDLRRGGLPTRKVMKI